MAYLNTGPTAPADPAAARAPAPMPDHGGEPSRGARHAMDQPGPARTTSQPVPVLLADEFFRLAHNDSTGRRRLHGRAIELGLAAALLGELMFERKVAGQDGQLHLLDPGPPADALAHATLDQLLAQPQHRNLRVWLDFLSRDAYESVAHRLWKAGHVRPEARRVLLRQTVIYVPTDSNAAVWPWARLSTGLIRNEPFSPVDAFLVGLAAVTGLDSDLLDGAPAPARRYMRHLVASAHPSLRELLWHTQAAVGDAVLAYRG